MIFVKNCMKGEKAFKCTECFETHALREEGFLINFNFGRAFWQQDMAKMTNQCVLLAEYYETQPIAAMNNSSCDVFNNDSRSCSTCAASNYKTFSSSICCPFGSILTKVGEIETCIALSLVTANCLDFDSDSYLCLVCDNTKKLSNGVCCAPGEFFNLSTHLC